MTSSAFDDTPTGSDQLKERDASADEVLGVERPTAQIELLWDLLFAFAVTRVTTLLGAHLTWAGFGRSMLVLALVWWAWAAFAWVANAHDPDAASFQLTFLLAGVLTFIVGVALPRAFGADARLFAFAYAGVRFLHLALYADASQHGHASARSITGFAVTTAIGLAILVIGSFTAGTARVALWTSAAAIDYAGPAWLTRERLKSLQQVAVAHFAERYGMFIIICLGESIVAIGTPVSAHVTPGSVAALTVALLITIGLWSTYFDRAAEEGAEGLRSSTNPVLAAADGYSYLHLVLVAGILIFAVGAHVTVAHVRDPLPSATRLALCGGVAAYLLGHTAFRLRVSGTIRWSEPTVAAVALALFAVSKALPAWAVSILLLAQLVALVTWERRGRADR